METDRAITQPSKILYVCRYLFLFFLAFGLATLFCFFLFPTLFPYYTPEMQNSDFWWQLGLGLWKNHTLSFYPSTEATLLRPPIYPLFVASIQWLTSGSGQGAIYIGQCLLFAMTPLVVYWMGTQLFSQRTAWITALICCFHPLLIWYTNRMWIESLAIFLTTSLMAAIVLVSKKSTWPRIILVGGLIGILTLTKATFLPFALLVPLLYRYTGHAIHGKQLIGIFCVATAVVSLWTIRNYVQSGAFIPVHLLLGYNLQRGDDFVKYATLAPLSYSALYHQGNIENPFFNGKRKGYFRTKKIYEIEFDHHATDVSLEYYQTHPLFLPKKIVFNAFWFWCLAQTRTNTLFLLSIQLPLLCFFCLSIKNMILNGSLHSVKGIHVGLMLIYFLLHLPIFAFARLSVVLIPTMLLYGVDALLKMLNFHKRYPIDEAV